MFTSTKFSIFRRILDENSPFFSFWYIKFIIALHKVDIAYYIPYLNFFAKTVSIIMRAGKAGIRFVALYFPVYYPKLTRKITILTALMVTFLTMLIYFPPFVSWAMDVEGNHGMLCMCAGVDVFF
jgi:hypothetical protein